MSKSIEVQMAEFLIIVSDENDETRRITDCGFGREEGNGNQTPILIGGALSDWKRKRDYVSSTYNAPMPFSLFLKQNLAIAFHQGDPFDESHGCIHLNRDDAAWLFEWAGDDPVAVDIRGPHPIPGVRARVYRSGAPNMLARIVTRIQEALIAEELLTEQANGTFGAETESAVSRYQQLHSLGVDGKVGSETFLRMGIEP